MYLEYPFCKLEGCCRRRQSEMQLGGSDADVVVAIQKVFLLIGSSETSCRLLTVFVFIVLVTLCVVRSSLFESCCVTFRAKMPSSFLYLSTLLVLWTAIVLGV